MDEPNVTALHIRTAVEHEHDGVLVDMLPDPKADRLRKGLIVGGQTVDQGWSRRVYVCPECGTRVHTLHYLESESPTA
jgi:hypothetical protein